MAKNKLDITNEHCPMTFVKTKVALSKLSLRFVKKERHVERNGEKFVASTYVVVTQLDC